MDELALALIRAQEYRVLWLGFVVSLGLGWAIERSHFCTMGAISDWLLMGDASRLRQWALALSLAMLGLAAMSSAGVVNPLDSIYALPRFPWLSYLVGGVMLGMGMVLASGCPTKNLVRLGAGNLKALVVLLVMGLFALASMRGLPGLWRVQWLDPYTFAFGSGPFVGQWLAAKAGWSATQGWVVTALLVSIALLLWGLSDRAFARDRKHWLAGLGVALPLLLLWWISGSLALVPEHPLTLERLFVTTASGRMEGLSFTGPLAQWLDAFIYAADGRKTLYLGMVLVPGVVLGSFFSAWRSGHFRWQGFTRTDDLVRHLLGAALMGMGGVMAMGCTFGQGLTGLSTLNWGSLVAVPAMVAGAALCLRLQWWLLERHV